MLGTDFPCSTTNQKTLEMYPDLGRDHGHQYGISALISQMSFCRETSGGVAKYWLFSLATSFQTLFQYISLAVQIKLRSTSDQNLDIHCTFLQGLTDAFKWVDGVRRRLAIACL